MEGSDKEDNNYFLNLNNNAMDLIENILKRIELETKERKEAFYDYVPNIIYYINFMFQKDYFMPDKDYLISCLSSIYYLMERVGMTIRDRIFDKLAELNMTQKEFAKRTGIPETTVSDWKKKISFI